jgi:predicted  nucleic acid-binding Zn-ribbon protein
MLEGDELTAEIKRAEAELATEQKAVDSERRAMAAEQSELEATLERVALERESLVRALEPRLLGVFEQVAKKRSGIAVSEARDGICTICHVRLRPQVFNTVRRNDAIIQCDYCNRILYFVPVPAAAPAAADRATPAP